MQKLLSGSPSLLVVTQIAAAASALADHLPSAKSTKTLESFTPDTTIPIVLGSMPRDNLAAGEVFLATEAKTPTRVTPCPPFDVLSATLREQGLVVRTGPVANETNDPATSRMHGLDALLGHEAIPPVTIVGLPAESSDAHGAFAAALHMWNSALGARHVVLASPRSACAGVDRAIEVVERTLDRFGPPIYVRKQIVHNEHVVALLAEKGAVFVEEVEDVPRNSVLIYSAHGVSPEVSRHVVERELTTIDATCPLVAKVHSEARHHAEKGRTIVYIGHSDHEESEGTMGEAPEAMRLVQNVEDVWNIEVDDPGAVAYLTQTTLAVDDTRQIVDELRTRFPRLHGPRGEDICYATTNRQQAIQNVASDVDLVLVIGSHSSSNAQRLVEVVARGGRPARLIENAAQLHPHWLRGIVSIGITSAASTPEILVRRTVDALAALGPLIVSEKVATRESMTFTLPPQVR